jgi:polysaccharide deacetylase 2 family uncharacterized protein YibQ
MDATMNDGQGTFGATNDADGWESVGAEHGDEQVIRGILAGFLWGSVIGAVVLALTSQLADWRDLTPAVAELDTQGESAPATPAVESETTPTVLASPERAPRVEEETPQVSAGAADEITAPMLDTSPPSAPLATATSEGISVEVALAEAPALPAPVDAPTTDGAASIEIAAAPTTDAPPLPGKPALAPASSAPDAKAEIAALAAPAALEASDTLVVAEAAEVAMPRVVADAPAAVVPANDAAPETPVAPEPVAEIAQTEAVQVPEAGPENVADAVPAKEPAPQPIEIAQAEPSAPLREAEPEIDVSAPEIAPVTSGQVGNGNAGDNPQVIRIGEGERKLPGASVSRLPSVGDTQGSDTVTPDSADIESTEAEATPEVAPDAEKEDMTALARNRVAFEPPEGAGLIAVVLVHEGGAPLSLPADADLPIPVTVAIPASLADAADVARAYRDAGQEVALIPDLPPRATAQDVEVALPVNLEVIPFAVAVMDAGGNGFQNDREATESVIATLAESGHGLLTWPKGFNTAQQMADKEGIPSALVFRQLVSDSPGAVVRALDQVAFRARQEGGIVMVTTADPVVVEGLVTWAAKTRREDTSLAPLSAVLSGS